MFKKNNSSDFIGKLNEIFNWKLEFEGNYSQHDSEMLQKTRKKSILNIQSKTIKNYCRTLKQNRNELKTLPPPPSKAIYRRNEIIFH